MKPNYERASQDAFAEVLRAKTLFPEKFANQHEGYAVILEELDELWAEVKMNQRDYRLDEQRKEAIQIAAMAIRFAAELTPSELQSLTLAEASVDYGMDGIAIRGKLTECVGAPSYFKPGEVYRLICLDAIDMRNGIAKQGDVTICFSLALPGGEAAKPVPVSETEPSEHGTA